MAEDRTEVGQPTLRPTLPGLDAPRRTRPVVMKHRRSALYSSHAPRLGSRLICFALYFGLEAPVHNRERRRPRTVCTPISLRRDTLVYQICLQGKLRLI